MNLSVKRLSVYTLTDLVQQRTGAANNFNGLEPETDVFTAQGRFEWPASTNAGLIDPTALGLSGSFKIVRISLAMAGQDTFTVDIIDGSNVINLATGTNATSFNLNNAGYLMDGQKLRILTTGAATSSVKAVVGLADARAAIAV